MGRRNSCGPVAAEKQTMAVECDLQCKQYLARPCFAITPSSNAGDRLIGLSRHPMCPARAFLSLRS